MIARRFRGPPASANGGYACGVVAETVEGTAMVTLRVPPPLDHPMTLRGDGVTGRLSDGGQLVAEARSAALDIEVPDSPSLEWDVAILKGKIDAGATRAITQFAFDYDLFARFRDRARAAGINVPIVPGLMPTTNFKGVARMAARCGASIPDWLSALYDGLDNDLESRKLVASAVLVEQVRHLRAEGFDQFHFYTLNRAELTYAICHLLGLKADRHRQQRSHAA